MLKRLVTFLLGLGLIGLGVSFFLAPEQAYVVQGLKRYWPLCLVLAGLVRFAGYAIDRHPRSPVGSLLLTALGGILLAVNLRGESSLTAILGHYWFWLLLAYMLGRVLRQYTHRQGDGKPVHALSPGAICVMLLLAGTGLTANYLTQNNQLLANLQQRLGRIGTMGDYVFGNPIKIEDEPPQSFRLPSNGQLSFNLINGDIEIRTGAVTQATAKLTKHIRATSEERAREAAKSIHLQITPTNNHVQLGVVSDNLNEPFTASLLVEIPGQTTVNVEVNEATGTVKLTGLRGDHLLRNCGHINVARNLGRLTVEGARGALALDQHEGDVVLNNLRNGAELSEIKGQISLTAQGGKYRLNNVIGAVRANVTNGRLELRGIQAPQAFPAQERLISLEEIRDTRLNLNDISGNLYINANRSRIEADTLTGDVQIAAVSDAVKLFRCTGNLRIMAENASVSVMDLHGAAQIEATRDITVQNFAGPLNAKSRTGKINLSQNAELSGDVVAVSEHGQVRVTLPRDIAFRLDASTHSGRLRARGFEEIRVARNQKSLTFNYHVNNNAPLVSLRSSSGNIELQSSGLALASNDE